MRDWVHKYKIVNADALAVNAGNLYDAMNAGRVGIGPPRELERESLRR